jgi:hypothetical protein
MGRPQCDGGHCEVTEYRETNIVLTNWSGTTDDGRTVGAPINPKWKYYRDWRAAFVAGLAAYWVTGDDCCACCADDGECPCVCDTSGNQPGPWITVATPRKFRQPVTFPGYKEFYIHGTYTLEYRNTSGICLSDPGEEGEGSMALQWAKDKADAIGKESGAKQKK